MSVIRRRRAKTLLSHRQSLRRSKSNAKWLANSEDEVPFANTPLHDPLDESGDEISPLDPIGSRSPKDIFNQIKDAIQTNELERLEFLLQQISPKEFSRVSTCRRYSPLHYAVKRGRTRAIRLLLEAKADVNGLSKTFPTQDTKEIAYDDQTPLHYACRYDQQKAAKELLKHEKIKLRVKDFHRRTPIELARQTRAYQVGQLIAVHMADRKPCKSLEMNEMGVSDRSPIFQTIVSFHMNHLTTINLSQNLLTTIPSAILDLPNLTYLDVSHNSIRFLPSTITKLEMLRVLNVDYNELHLLPLSLIKLKHLHKLRCKHNPLTLFPLKNTKKDSEILKAIRHLNAGQESWRKAKLTILGAHDVGKTTLMRTLKKCESSTITPLLSRASASGSVIRSRSVLTRSASNVAPLQEERLEVTEAQLPNKVTLSCWDFGRNEIVHRTYRFFLTPRGIYIVAFRACQIDPHVIDFWISQIRSVSMLGKSIVLLVGTHMDDPCFTPEKREAAEEILRTYVSSGRARSYHFVNSKNRERVQVLQQALVDVTAGHGIANFDVPVHWAYVALECLNLRDYAHLQWMSWEDFQQKMNATGIPDDEQEAALEFLRDSGRLCFYPPSSHGPGFVVLVPRWMSQTMGCIAEYFLRNTITDGLLEMANLPRVWRQFPDELYSSFLYLMEQQEICFSLRSNPHAVFLPSMLPDELPPSVNELWPTHVPHSLRQYGRTYRFSMPPQDAFFRIMVRLMHMKDTECLVQWRAGILLKNKSEIALVQREKTKDDINIRVRGDQHGTPVLLRGIISLMDTMIESLYSQSEKIQVLIPCIHCLRHSPYADPFMFGKEDVVLAWTSGTPFVYCRNINSSSRCVRIDSLAPDLSFGDIPVLHDLQMEKKIAEGGFGAVYKGTLLDFDVAIKELHSNEGLTEFEEFSREVYTMSSLDHPNLVKLFGIALHPLRMVMEYVPMDLYHLLHSSQTLSIYYRLRLALDVAYGMQYLQDISPPIMHRDLRSPNILIVSVDENAEVIAKVADFGLALSVAPQAAGFLGTWQWHAPEVLDSDSPFYDETADVYSFGVLMWEIFTSGYPFEEYRFHPEYSHCVGEQDGEEVWQFRIQSIKRAIIRDGLRPTFTDPDNETVPLVCVELVERCWMTEKSARPSFTEITESLVRILKHLCGPRYRAYKQAQHRKKRMERQATLESSLEGVQPLPQAKRRRNFLSLSDAEGTVFKIDQRPLCIHFYEGLVWIGCNEGALHVYKADDLSLVVSHKNHLSRIYAIHSIGDQIWTSSEEGGLFIFNAKTTARITYIENAHDSHMIRYLMPVENDDVATMWSCAPAHDRIIAWDTETFEQVYSFYIGHTPINCLLLREGLLWAGTHKDVLLYKIDYKTYTLTKMEVLAGHSRKVNQICAVTENELWSCSDDGSIRVWDPVHLTCNHTLDINSGPIRCIQKGGNNVWVGVQNKALVSWSIDTHTPVHELATSESVLCLSTVNQSVWMGLADSKIQVLAQVSARLGHS